MTNHGLVLTCLVVLSIFMVPAALALAAYPQATGAPSDYPQPGVSVVVGDGPGWRVRFTLKDYLQEYVFPEELISYRVTCPPKTVRKAHLKLVSEATGDGLVYQLSDVQESDGFLDRATISFRTTLNKGEQKSFLLNCDPLYQLQCNGGVAITDIDAADHTAILRANTQQVKVPYGDFAPHAPLATVAAPIVQIARSPGVWIGGGTFTGQAIAETVHTTVLDPGPLRLRYRIEYTLAGGKQYTVVLTLQHNENDVTVDEYLHGIDVADALVFKFSYHAGIDPDGRITMANNGDYFLRSGAYTAGVSDGVLPYVLSIFGPNVACPRSTVFYKNDDANGSAVVFSLYRLKDWKTHVRYTWWEAAKAEEALRFHADADQYMTAQLAGSERHWALAIIPRAAVTIESQDGSKRDYWPANNQMTGLSADTHGGDPSARLFQKLGAYSLDWVKDLLFDFDEDLDVVYDHHTEAMTYQQFNNHGEPGGRWEGTPWWGGADWAWRWLPVERYQDGMCYGAKSPGRTHWQTLAAYAASRKNWTPEQRLKVRSWLVHFVATYMFLDDNLPHFSMVAGHPNFVIESLYPGVFAAVFPKHPYNAQFKQIYQDILNEYLDVYIRKAKPEINAQGGCHTENIACYSYASLQGVLHNAVGYQQYDGADILTNPAFLDWIRWHMNALITAGERQDWEFNSNAYTLTPPEGAHANQTMKVLYDTADYLERNHNPLGAQLKWALTKGAEGTQPPLQSALFYDYGPVLRYDFGGAHEAYLHMLHLGDADPMPGYQISGLHYRWGGAANGAIYYAARGHTWSWNKQEDCGDGFNIKGLCAFETTSAATQPSKLSAYDGLTNATTRPHAGLGFRKLSADTPLLNLGAVQFFRSAEDAQDNYVSRTVMMVGDRYLAVYDRVKDVAVQGVFHWNNRRTGVKVEYFQDTDFRTPLATFVDASRFPLDHHIDPAIDKTGQGLWNGSGLNSAQSFSVRFTTRINPGSEESKAGNDWNATTFAQQLGLNDRGSLWIDGKPVLDGQNGAKGTIALAYNQEHELRYEYVHSPGSYRAQLQWTNRPGGRAFAISGANCCTYYRDLPAIYNVAPGAGNQLHMVEPSTRPTLTVTAKPYGALVVSGGQNQYLLMCDHADEFHDAALSFQGRSGYAADNELFLFEGRKLALGDFGIETAGGNFAVSARLNAAAQIDGRVAGAAGGTILLTLPPSAAPPKELAVDGQPVAFAYDSVHRTVKFAIPIALSDGYKSYTLH